MALIDDEAAKMIKQIDEIKVDIMTKSGEDATTMKDKDEETIIWTKYDKSRGALPVRMNLMAVQAKDQYDIPMHEIIGEDIKNHRVSVINFGMILTLTERKLLN